MKKNATTNALLFVIAIAMLVIAARPFLQPVQTSAEALAPYPFYIEPGTQMLRSPDGTSQVYGKMVVDMQTGKIWGFPTLNASSPYPVDVGSQKPPVSHPFLLGTYAFSDIYK